jgi:hypothetical protein
MRATRRTWAAMARHHVAFSDLEDARIEATVNRPIRPDWANVSGVGRNAAFYPAALQYLYEVGRARGTRLFVNFDDDAQPLWPALLHNLRQGQEAHGGRYAWMTSGQVDGLTNLEDRRMLYKWEASGSEEHKLRLALGDKGALAPSGFMYAFNLSALHDMMAVVETCPIVYPGDGMMGGLLACAGRMLQVDISKGRGTHRDPGWMPDGVGSMDGLDFALLRAGGGNVSGLYGDFPGGGLLGSVYPGAERTTVYHRMKSIEELVLLYDRFYPAFGWPSWRDLPDRNHHSGEDRCSYASPGVHMFEWGR